MLRDGAYRDNKRIESRAKGFMSGVLLLSLSTLLVKIIGLAFKIPMLSFLGTEGMGYFNSAYEIYALLCTVSTAGLPVALSMLVSAARTRGDGEGIKRIYRTAKLLFLALGGAGSALMLIFARQLSVLIGNPDAYMCIMAIAPALLFICMASAVRGYCQGFENMTPTAVSQLIEAISKLLLGIVFARAAIKKGYGVPAIAAFAVLGVTVGTLLSALYLGFARIKIRKAEKEVAKNGSRRGKVLTPLVKIAFPITLGSALLGVTRIIDMTLIMRRLGDIGVSVAQANRIYGAYTTLALPVFSLIPALITPVSMALVPQLVSFIEEKNGVGQRTVLENSMRLTVLFAMPSSLGLAAFSRPVLEILFRGQSEAIDIAAPLLAVLGISVLFSCLITTTNAIIQAYGRPSLPIFSMLVGVLVKLAVSYVLIGNPSVGVMGAPIGSLACNVAVTAINLYFTGKNSSCAFDVRTVFFKPVWVSLLSVGASLAIYVGVFSFAQNLYLSFAIALVAAVTSYLAFSWLIRSITVEDISLLPFGERIAGALIKNKEKDKSCGGKNDCKRNEEGTS